MDQVKAYTSGSNGEQAKSYNSNGKGHAKPSRRTGSRLRNGVCLAAKRADTAVQLINEWHIKPTDAAERTGSNVAYIYAWQRLREAGVSSLIDAVWKGRISMPTAAKCVKQLAKLKTAFAAADSAERAIFFKLDEVKAAGVAAGATVSPLKKLRAVVDAVGIDQVRNLLTIMDKTAPGNAASWVEAAE